MIRPKPDIPERVPILSFPSPAGKADLLFYEIRDGSLPKNQNWAYGDPHPDSANYPHHELVFVAPEGSSSWQRWYYAAAREEQHIYNWQVTDTSEWPQIVQSFVVRRADFSVSSIYEMPPAEFFPYPREWAVTGVEERPVSDETLASTYVTVMVTREKIYKRQVLGTADITTVAGEAGGTISSPIATAGDYLECPEAFLPPGTLITSFTAPGTIVTASAAFASGTFFATAVSYVANEVAGKEFDADINALSPYRRAKVPSSTTIPSGIQADGSIVELQPVNSLWSIKTTKQASGLAGSAINGKATRTFQIVTNWAWPAVLDYVKITPVYADDTDIYSAVTGYVTTPIFAVDAYSGPCLATIIEEWTSEIPVVGGDPTWDSTKTTSPHLPEPTPLLPKSISFSSPLLNVSVPECLHDYITFYAANFQQEYLATNYTRWPGSVIAEVDLRPHQGGWLKRVMVVNCPSQAGVAPDLYLRVTDTFATSFQLEWENLSDTTALKLDVSSDPSFKTGYLSGFRDLSVLGLTTKLVTDVPRGVPYYARLTVTRTVGAGSVTTQSNIAVVMCPPQPEIELFTPGDDGVSGTEDDVSLPATTGVFTFGEALTVGGVTKPFIIRNDGLLSLSGLSVEFSGTNAAFFSVVGSLPEAIPPGGFAAVNVQLLPVTAVGAVSATMTVLSNAVNNSAYAVTVTGTAVQPEIDVTYLSVSQPSGSSISLGNANTGTSTDYTFTILNTGNGPLNASVSIIDAVDPAVWSLVDGPDAPIPAGGSDDFTVRITPAAAGARSLAVSISNNDPTGSENPYLLTLSATGVAVGEIEVASPVGATLAAGGSFYFGFSDTAVSKPEDFTVINVGVGTLGSLSAALSGPDAAEFSLGSLVTSLSSGGSTTLTVSFTPATTGAKSAVLTISSDDPLQPSYTVNLSGTGGIEHEIQVESPRGEILVTGVSETAFGNILTGTSRAVRFWVSNVGNARLTSLAVSVTGGDAAKFAVSALTPVVTYLDPGEEAYFDVTLTPDTTIGPLTTTLSIASNDHDENPFLVALYGFAYAAGSLATAQPLAVVLGQTDFTADLTATTNQSTLRNVVGSRAVVSPSGRVAVADTGASRVLIWESYSSLASGQAASVVLGQSNFTSYLPVSVVSGATFNSPKAVAWYGDQLLVADSGRNRILIFNNPTSSGQSASLVLGQTSFTGTAGGCSLTKFRGVTDIFVVPSPDLSGRGKSGHVIVADPDNNRVMVWTTFPSVNNAAATYVLGQPTSTASTAGRTYTSGGAILPRFYAPRSVCVSSTDGRLYVADTNNWRVIVYPSIPSSANSPQSDVLFQSSLTGSVLGLGRDRTRGPWGVSVSAAGHLAVSDPYNKRALLFYTSAVTGSLPHAVLGQPDFDTDATPARSESTLTAAAGLTWQAGDLLVTDRNRVCIFKP